MASSTYKTFLMVKDTSTYKKLVDIKDYPDLGGEPNMLETTTLSNKMQTFTPGVEQISSFQFTANYDKADYEALEALEGVEKDFAVWFGGTVSGSTVTPTGEDGKWKFKGKLDVYVSGSGVDEVREMIITIAPSTDVEYDSASA